MTRKNLIVLGLFMVALAIVHFKQSKEHRSILSAIAAEKVPQEYQIQFAPEPIPEPTIETSLVSLSDLAEERGFYEVAVVASTMAALIIEGNSDGLLALSNAASELSICALQKIEMEKTARSNSPH